MAKMLIILDLSKSLKPAKKVEMSEITSTPSYAKKSTELEKNCGKEDEEDPSEVLAKVSKSLEDLAKAKPIPRPAPAAVQVQPQPIRLGSLNPRTDEMFPVPIRHIPTPMPSTGKWDEPIRKSYLDTRGEALPFHLRG